MKDVRYWRMTCTWDQDDGFACVIVFYNENRSVIGGRELRPGESVKVGSYAVTAPTLTIGEPT